VVETILKSEEEINETSRIICEILRLLGVRMIEEVDAMKDGEQMKERWERLKAGIEAQGQFATFDTKLSRLIIELSILGLH